MLSSQVVYQLKAAQIALLCFSAICLWVLQWSAGSSGSTTYALYHCSSWCCLFPWMMLATDSLTALYITGYTTFTSSIVLVRCCLPCVHHGLLQFCKTWLSTCRRCCTVDVTAIQQKIYMCHIKVSTLEQSEGWSSPQKVLLPQRTQLMQLYIAGSGLAL